MAKRKQEQSDVEQLKGILQQFPLDVWSTALAELGYSIAIGVGHQVKKFVKITFERGAWIRSSVTEGCVTYTAAPRQGKPPEESEVTVILPNGKKQVHLYGKGEEVLVCGDVVYLPPDNPRCVR